MVSVPAVWPSPVGGMGARLRNGVLFSHYPLVNLFQNSKENVDPLLVATPRSKDRTIMVAVILSPYSGPLAARAGPLGLLVAGIVPSRVIFVASC